MFRIIDNRSSGKTGRLMLLAKEENAIIVCSNPRAMERKALNYGIVGLEFISYGDFLCNGFEGKRKILIDELENFTKSIWSNTEIIGYTITSED